MQSTRDAEDRAKITSKTKQHKIFRPEVPIKDSDTTPTSGTPFPEVTFAPPIGGSDDLDDIDSIPDGPSLFGNPQRMRNMGNNYEDEFDDKHVYTEEMKMSFQYQFYKAVLGDDMDIHVCLKDSCKDYCSNSGPFM